MKFISSFDLLLTGSFYFKNIIIYKIPTFKVVNNIKVSHEVTKIEFGIQQNIINIISGHLQGCVNIFKINPNENYKIISNFCI